MYITHLHSSIKLLHFTTFFKTEMRIILNEFWQRTIAAATKQNWVCIILWKWFLWPDHDLNFWKTEIITRYYKLAVCSTEKKILSIASNFWLSKQHSDFMICCKSTPAWCIFPHNLPHSNTSLGTRASS